MAAKWFSWTVQRGISTSVLELLLISFWYFMNKIRYAWQLYVRCIQSLQQYETRSFVIYCCHPFIYLICHYHPQRMWYIYIERELPLGYWYMHLYVCLYFRQYMTSISQKHKNAQLQHNHPLQSTTLDTMGIKLGSLAINIHHGWILIPFTLSLYTKSTRGTMLSFILVLISTQLWLFSSYVLLIQIDPFLWMILECLLAHTSLWYHTPCLQD